jgi:hypothetical protein
MSDRLSKLVAGLVTLLIAGAAVACPGAAKDQSAAAGQNSSAQSTLSQAGRS